MRHARSDHGDCCPIPLAAYVAGARKDLAVGGFHAGHDTNIIHHLLLEVDRLQAALDLVIAQRGQKRTATCGAPLLTEKYRGMRCTRPVYEGERCWQHGAGGERDR